MALNATCCFASLLMLAASASASAPSLNEPPPVGRVMGAAQFGMPADAKYVFCDGQDCPDRSTKTMPALKPPAPKPAPVVIPAPQSVLPPPELSRAKEPEPPKPVPKKVKKPTRKKRAVKLDCSPITSKPAK